MGVIYERQVPAVVRWLGARFSDGPRSWRMTWGSLSIRRGLAFGLWLFEEGFSFHVHALRVSVYVRLPFLSRFAWEPRDICESWGLSTCDNSVHVSWGHRSKCFDVPWSTWVRVSQEVRRADGSWVPYVGIWERGKQRDGRHVETHSYRYMLQSGEVQERLAEQSPPDILTQELTGLLLDAAQWGARVESLPLLDMPPAAAVASAQRLLVSLGLGEARLSLGAQGSNPSKAFLHALGSRVGSQALAVFLQKIGPQIQRLNGGRDVQL